jgi:hypothetical protein
MKCDDDTFVRIDSVLDQVKKVPSGGSMYVGNINYYHRPLRSGKWAVTYEVSCSFLCNYIQHAFLKEMKESLCVKSCKFLHWWDFHYSGY